ncbi:MAG: pentapeptide repeat-containing protein [Microcoleus sp.]
MDISQILADSKLYWETNGEKGQLVDLRGADLRGADLRSADLRGADLSDAVLTNATLPTRGELLSHLLSHVKTEQYDQSRWCGTNCCLSGAAGQLISNQSAGVALIMQVLPEFDVSVLYLSLPDTAIAELERVAAL